jgi:hypothetical protein
MYRLWRGGTDFSLAFFDPLPPTVTSIEQSRRSINFDSWMDEEEMGY